MKKLFLEKLKTWHLEEKRIVLVTGVFDILHHAHLQFLDYAKKEGDILLVGLESDLRARKLKGEGRPINPQEKRRANLLKTEIADEVFILPEEFNKKEDYLGLLQQIKPAVLAVSAHTKHQAVKSELMQEVGGELKVVMEHDPSVSTTKLLSRSSS